ncbi:hypothetical protein GCM10010277_88370 [Streptomyces longisporoflavus]|nr:hypothetical protein GCM10010277_88370 [Streptomyces longisporoflavus]
MRTPCRQATFAEQVDWLTVRHDRRSTGLQGAPERLAVTPDRLALACRMPRRPG